MKVTEALNKLDISYETITHKGETYVLTTGTGECHYEYGQCSFAYYADDEKDDVVIETYNDFCESFATVEDKRLAYIAAKQGLRLTEAGPCSPVLTDGEYLMAREELTVWLDGSDDPHAWVVEYDGRTIVTFPIDLDPEDIGYDTESQAMYIEALERARMF